MDVEAVLARREPSDLPGHDGAWRGTGRAWGTTSGARGPTLQCRSLTAAAQSAVDRRTVSRLLEVNRAGDAGGASEDDNSLRHDARLLR